MSFLRRSLYVFSRLVFLNLLISVGAARANVPLDGFIPLVGMALSNEYETLDTSGTFFISEPAYALGGSLLGPGSDAYYDVALLDTGTATHIITAAATAGFNIDQEGFDGENFQTIGGATGLIDLRIEDPLGVYIAGLSDSSTGPNGLTLNTGALRGQTSFSLLSAPPSGRCPTLSACPWRPIISFRFATAIRRFLN